MKFSMAIDEYMSVRRRRYFCITLRASDDKKEINLGLVRIFGSLPAEKMAVDVKKHLELFSLNLDEDIVASTSDGASVMKKYGRLISSIIQLCFNHAIHLGVCDCLYKKKFETEQSTQDVESDGDDDFDDQETANQY